MLGDKLISVCGGYHLLKPIEFFLTRRNSRIVLGTVVSFFRPHIHHKSDGQEVKVTDRNAYFHTAEEKQRCCHFPAAAVKFFLD